MLADLIGKSHLKTIWIWRSAYALACVFDVKHRRNPIIHHFEIDDISKQIEEFIIRQKLLDIHHKFNGFDSKLLQAFLCL